VTTRPRRTLRCPSPFFNHDFETGAVAPHLPVQFIFH
jgi:hypothetical protein